jgi:hypothetical protein
MRNAECGTRNEGNGACLAKRPAISANQCAPVFNSVHSSFFIFHFSLFQATPKKFSRQLSYPLLYTILDIKSYLSKTESLFRRLRERGKR